MTNQITQETAKEMLDILKTSHRKLMTYGYAYPGDKELHLSLIPRWEEAIAKAKKELGGE